MQFCDDAYWSSSTLKFVMKSFKVIQALVAKSCHKCLFSGASAVLRYFNLQSLIQMLSAKIATVVLFVCFLIP